MHGSKRVFMQCVRVAFKSHYVNEDELLSPCSEQDEMLCMQELRCKKIEKTHKQLTFAPTYE